MRLGLALLTVVACERAERASEERELVGPRPIILDAAPAPVDALTVRPPDPLPSPPPAPTIVPPTLLEGQRIAGTPVITPDLATREEMRRDGVDKVVASMKLCTNTTGDVISVTQLKSSRYPAYDQKLESEIARWRYRPWQVNGRTVPVCTAVTFIARP